MKRLLFLYLLLPLALFAQDDLDIRIPCVDMRDFYDQEKQDSFLDTLYEAMTELDIYEMSAFSMNAINLWNLSMT